ncbi:MAG: amino acid racemase, partial [Hyphomicrobiaceae bacterium]|nr:amino acid racemase [Hyphomicrobiaceae bacterium]
MVKHIGIVGCSAEGAALCYRTICLEGARLLGAHAHPEISMHTPPLSDYVACLERGDMEGVGRIMLDSADKLTQAGADFLICPDNTIHKAFEFAASRSALSWLHIADVVAGEAKSRGFERAVILGTKWLMESDVYPDKLAAAGLEWQLPTEPERDELNRIIMDELVSGELKAEALAFFQAVIRRRKQAGCDVAILGCTEIPLLIDDGNAPLPTLDSTR